MKLNWKTQTGELRQTIRASPGPGRIAARVAASTGLPRHRPCQQSRTNRSCPQTNWQLLRPSAISPLSSERWSLRSAWPGQQASRRLTAVTRLETLFLLKSVRGATDGPTPTHPTTEPLSCFAGARGDLEGVVGVAGG